MRNLKLRNSTFGREIVAPALWYGIGTADLGAIYNYWTRQNEQQIDIQINI